MASAPRPRTAAAIGAHRYRLSSPLGSRVFANRISPIDREPASRTRTRCGLVSICVGCSIPQMRSVTLLVSASMRLTVPSQ
jgi:hypothetical protein